MIKYPLFFILGLLLYLRPAFAQNDTFYLMFGSGYTFEREFHGYLETEKNDIITRRGSSKDRTLLLDFGFYPGVFSHSLLGFVWNSSFYHIGAFDDATKLDITTRQVHVSYLSFLSNLPPQSFYVKIEIGGTLTTLLKQIDREKVNGRGGQWGPSGRIGTGYSFFTSKASGFSFLMGVNYNFADAGTLGALSWTSAELSVLW